VLDDGTLALVDFEYAARAAPQLDIANLAARYDFDAAEQRALLAVYRRVAPASAELAELAWRGRMVGLMAWFWALLGAARTDDQSLYEPYLAELGAQLRRAG
jgi:thiamine kinase-like enzyme